MLKVEVSQVGCDAQTGNAVVILNLPGCEKILPIWIGVPEATAISCALHDIKTGRPLTHQLLFNVIETLNYEVEKVEITEIKNQAFLASLYVVEKSQPGKKKNTEQVAKIIDARPSDAIVLALLGSAPIYVSPPVFEQAAVSAKAETEKESKIAPFMSEKKAADDESFKRFVQDLKASDFKLPDDKKGA